MIKKIEANEPKGPSLEIPVGPRLERVLEIAYRSRRAVLLEGPTGIGKSEIVRQVADRLGLQTVVLDLSLLEPPDLVGLPIIRGQETAYAPPQILPKGGAGILMLEELNRAERYIQQPALQLLTARRLHEYELPEGWSAYAAINPDTGDYQVTPLDFALRARFLNLILHADRSTWLLWAKKHGIHAAIIRLASLHDRFLEDVPPRTWTYASIILKTMTSPELRDKVLLRDILGGYLPLPWVELLLQEPALLEGDEGFDAYRLVREYHLRKELQESVRDLATAGRTDRLEQVCHRVRAILDGAELGKLLSEGAFELAAFEGLIHDLPGDRREALQEAFGRNPMASSLIGIQPEDVFDGYRGSTVAEKVKGWLKDSMQHHRLLSLVTSVDFYLQKMPNTALFREKRHAMISLGYFVDQVGPELGAPILKTIDKLGLRPIYPKGKR